MCHEITSLRELGDSRRFVRLEKEKIQDVKIENIMKV
jgi:hypothetical protein